MNTVTTVTTKGQVIIQVVEKLSGSLKTSVKETDHQKARQATIILRGKKYTNS